MKQIKQIESNQIKNEQGEVIGYRIKGLAKNEQFGHHEDIVLMFEHGDEESLNKERTGFLSLELIELIIDRFQANGIEHPSQRNAFSHLMEAHRILLDGLLEAGWQFVEEKVEYRIIGVDPDPDSNAFVVTLSNSMEILMSHEDAMRLRPIIGAKATVVGDKIIEVS